MKNKFWAIGSTLGQKRTIEKLCNPRRQALLAALSIVAIISLTDTASASTGNIVKSDLTGNAGWPLPRLHQENIRKRRDAAGKLLS
jgi:hypothetical protein